MRRRFWESIEPFALLNDIKHYDLRPSGVTKKSSIFEEHTDVIVKDRRDTHYGHKICLTGSWNP